MKIKQKRRNQNTLIHKKTIEVKITRTMEVLLLIPPALGAVAFAIFYFMKSSKEMPKNMKELWIELQVQHSGTQGLIEDLLFRTRNKVGEWFYTFVYFYTSCIKV